MAAFLGLASSLLGGLTQSKPSKAFLFLESNMSWLSEQRTAIRFGQGNDRAFLEATLKELDTREAQARAMPKTEKKLSSHPALLEFASLRDEIKRNLARLDSGASNQDLARNISGAAQDVTVSASKAQGSPIAQPGVMASAVAQTASFFRTTEGQFVLVGGGMFLLLLLVLLATNRGPRR